MNKIIIHSLLFTMESNQLDDSVCILYEKIEPRPEIEIVEEINILNSEENVPPEAQSFVDICEDSCEISEQVPSNEDSSILIIPNNRTQSDILCVNRVPSKPKASKNRNLKQVATTSHSGDQSTSQSESQVESGVRAPPQKDNVLENSPKKNKIKCGICFDGPEEMSSPRTLGSTVCGHLFCSTCMEASRKNSTQCPTCRKRLTKNQFHPIYF